jgi:hypothetical protein
MVLIYMPGSRQNIHLKTRLFCSNSLLAKIPLPIQISRARKLKKKLAALWPDNIDSYCQNRKLLSLTKVNWILGLNSTTITGLTVVSQPQLVVQSQSSLSVGLTGKMDESHPVDLAAAKKANLIPGVAPLKIPAVPQRPLPPRATLWVFLRSID